MKAAAHPKCVAWGHEGQSRFDDMAGVRYRKITLNSWPKRQDVTLSAGRIEMGEYLVSPIL